MRLDEATCWRLFAAARVARLATTGPDGPHLVPIVFAIVDNAIVTAVDHKPKLTTQLQRLANLRADPRAALLVDHYDDDWERLWWVRAHVHGTVSDDPEDIGTVLPALAARYPQYIEHPPPGPLIRLEVQRLTGWAASDSAVDER